MSITNKQRLLYLLDILAEPFPESAKLESCSCGANEQKEVSTEGVILSKESTFVPNMEDAKKTLYSIEGPMLSKRDLIEVALLEAYSPKKKFKTFDEFLNSLADDQIGKLLLEVDVGKIDQHLIDLSLFMDTERPIQTTVEEIIKWDTNHKGDFETEKGLREILIKK